VSIGNEVVTFENPAGMNLVGVLHRPAGPARREMMILLSPGVKNRIAPHGLYVKMASRFAALGYPVFRFDFHGLGDSEGVLPEEYLADVYRAIQLGRYVDDSIASMDWAESALGYKRFIMGGLCGGAISGLLAASKDARVVGLLGMGIPAVLDSATRDQARFMTGGQLNRLREGYLLKLASPRAWLNFLSFKSDYRMIVRSALARHRKGATLPDSRGASAPADNRNPLFAPALKTVLARGCASLLVFSGSDRLHWEFEEKYAESHRAVLEKYRESVTIAVIPEANHVFTYDEWQEKLFGVSSEWLTRRFAGWAVADVAKPEVS